MMAIQTILSIAYHQYTEYPSFYQAVRHISLGFIFFSSLFAFHQYWIGTLNSKYYRKPLSRSQIMEISVLVNSSIFAILICFASLSGKFTVHFIHVTFIYNHNINKIFGHPKFNLPNIFCIIVIIYGYCI